MLELRAILFCAKLGPRYISACRMWALFGKGATRLNYHIWRNISCVKPDGKKYEPIPHVFVMPFGKYVGPRVDFGGHEEFDKMIK